MGRYAISRRQLLRLAALIPAGAIIAACSKGEDEMAEAPGRRTTDAGMVLGDEREEVPEEPTPTATTPPTATPEPFILPAGEEQRLLMAGTPYETPYYVYGTGVLGPILVVLGGVHGNEPGGWLAAERIVEAMRPQAGGLLVVPRANRQAIDLFQRTTEELGDL